MYRPNRIGPFPLLNLESGPVQVTKVLAEAADGSISGIHCYASAAAALQSISARTLYCTEDWDLPATEGLALGVKVIGSQLRSQDEGYIYGVSGSIIGNCNVSELGLIPVIGRVSTNGLQTGFTITRYQIIPFDQLQSTGANRVFSSSFNTELISGDFTPTGSYDAEEVFCGYWMMNPTAGAAAMENVRVSISLHRYEYDMRPFDPNR